MVAGVRPIAAALAMVSVSFAAVAQVIPPGAQIVPPSDQPGRERERFERPPVPLAQPGGDRKSTRLNSSHQIISYAVFCLEKKTRVLGACRQRRAGRQDTPPAADYAAATPGAERAR